MRASERMDESIICDCEIMSVPSSARIFFCAVRPSRKSYDVFSCGEVSGECETMAVAFGGVVGSIVGIKVGSTSGRDVAVGFIDVSDADTVMAEDELEEIFFVVGRGRRTFCSVSLMISKSVERDKMLEGEKVN